MNPAPAASSAGLRHLGDLPGPPGVPFFGNALQVRRERVHLAAEQWAREYGAIFRFRLGARRILAVADPEIIASILRDRPEGFARTARLVQTARDLGFSGLFTSNGEAWRRQRPMVLGGLDPTHIREFFPTLIKVTQRFLRRWQQAAASGVAIDVQADLMRYTVDVTAGLAFGTDINTLESGGDVIQTHLDTVFPALFQRLFATVPYWKFVKLPADRKLDQHLAALSQVVAHFIDLARLRLRERPILRERPDNLIEAMVAARDRAGSGVTDEDVAGNVLTLLLAGEDTTANTLAWALWLLHRHPNAARQASEEADAILGTASVPGDSEQLGRLEYIEACAHETMRLKPVAPIIMVQAARPARISDVAVPAGTLVMCLMRPAGVDSRNFVDPQAFLPERWLSGAGPGRAASAARRIAMPFGAGPRLCPGRYLALAEMKMVLAMLLRNFEIAQITAAGGGEPRERLSLTMSPVGLAMRLRLRPPLTEISISKVP